MSSRPVGLHLNKTVSKIDKANQASWLMLSALRRLRKEDYLKVSGQPGPRSESQDVQGYRMRPSRIKQLSFNVVQ